VFSKEFVLLVRHKKGADNVTGIYGLPSGRLEDGETNISAAKRELAEETGLITTEEHLTQLPESYTGELHRKDGATRLFLWTVFLCRHFTGELKESKETSPEWVKISDVKNHHLLPNIENAINKALTIDKK
jgi:8-oxo-dGTP pyrophosphatase MutT (NUDIX family)